MKFSPLIFGFLLITFASCKRDKAEPDGPISMKIEGYVKEAQTTKNISGAVVRLLRLESGNIGGFPNFIILGESISDTTGYYKLALDTKYNDELFLDVEQRNYMYFPQQRMKVKTEYLRQDINLYIPGYVKVILENENPHEVTLIYWVEDSQKKTIKGKVKFAENIFKVTAKDHAKIFYNVIKDGILTEHIDSISIPLRDTATYHNYFK